MIRIRSMVEKIKVEAVYRTWHLNSDIFIVFLLLASEQKNHIVITKENKSNCNFLFDIK